MDSDNLDILHADLRVLQQGKETLLLSTQGEEYPEISYAPYVRDQKGCFYIFISQLAAHTKNLMNSPYASVMFIANEEQSQNLFARERAIYKCTSAEVSKEDKNYMVLLEQMENELGKVVGMLRSLPDFHLFCLQPTEGRYVVGFGKAYTIDLITGELIHITEEQVKKGR